MAVDLIKEHEDLEKKLQTAEQQIEVLQIQRERIMGALILLDKLLAPDLAPAAEATAAHMASEPTALANA